MIQWRISILPPANPAAQSTIAILKILFEMQRVQRKLDALQFRRLSDVDDNVIWVIALGVLGLGKIWEDSWGDV